MFSARVRVALDELQIGLPRVRADKLDRLSEFVTDHREETLEALHRAFLATHSSRVHCASI